MKSVPFRFSSLPPELSRLLVCGGEGSAHLVKITQVASKHGMDCLAANSALAAWEADPLNATAAFFYKSFLKNQPEELPSSLAELCATIVRYTVHPENLRYLNRLLERRDLGKMISYLHDSWNKDPENLFWPARLLTLCLYEGNFSLAEDVLSHPFIKSLPGVAIKLKGDLTYLADKYDQAFEFWEEAQALFKWPGLAARMAAAARQLGRKEMLKQYFKQALKNEPWRAGNVLAAYDHFSGRDFELSPLPGKTAILLYSWNKAQDLEKTLTSLASSDFSFAPNYAILVLNNGSTDDTDKVIGQAQESFVRPLKEIALPINCGAPAARNWLMREEEAVSADWLIYLDDDVNLAPDWLGRLGAAAKNYPQAGVYGCRVLDEAKSHLIQHADTFILPSEKDDLPDSGSLDNFQRRFHLSKVHLQTLDFGQFNYLRPCATVTGCCHLFAKEILFACGGFDLRYTPSQFDDLDHDIRLLLGKNSKMKSQFPVYQGHLPVKHFRSTGKNSAPGSPGYNAAFANQLKLHYKFSKEEIDKAIEFSLGSAAKDLDQKLDELEKFLE